MFSPSAPNSKGSSRPCSLRGRALYLDPLILLQPLTCLSPLQQGFSPLPCQDFLLAGTLDKQGKLPQGPLQPQQGCFQRWTNWLVLIPFQFLPGGWKEKPSLASGDRGEDFWCAMSLGLWRAHPMPTAGPQPGPFAPPRWCNPVFPFCKDEACTCCTERKPRSQRWGWWAWVGEPGGEVGLASPW